MLGYTWADLPKHVLITSISRQPIFHQLPYHHRHNACFSPRLRCYSVAGLSQEDQHALQLRWGPHRHGAAALLLPWYGACTRKLEGKWGNRLYVYQYRDIWSLGVCLTVYFSRWSTGPASAVWWSVSASVLLYYCEFCSGQFSSLILLTWSLLLFSGREEDLYWTCYLPGCGRCLEWRRIRRHSWIQSRYDLAVWEIISTPAFLCQQVQVNRHRTYITFRFWCLDEWQSPVTRAQSGIMFKNTYL